MPASTYLLRQDQAFCTPKAKQQQSVSASPSLVVPAGLLLYLLDLTFRLAQWMNVSIVTGSLLSENVLALNLQFTPVGALL